MTPKSSVPMSSIVRNSFLASVIARPRGTRPTGDDQYRRYKSNVRTESTIGGVPDSRVTQITYEVGRRYTRLTQALASPDEAGHRVECSYPTASSLVEDFIGLARKYSNFSASFEYSSLAPLVERLGRGLAAASLYGGVTSDNLRAQQPLNVNVLGTYDGPVNSLVNTVFIPRLVNSSISGDVFSVLVQAAAGEGAAVATDVLELDAVTRQPIIPLVGADGLPRAIVSALRILGSNMIAADQGPLFAYALVKGLHSVATVVGHTDEGGATRDMLRAGRLSIPFGGIHYGLPVYAGLPALSSNQVVDVAAFVDSLCLTSAALVAHADPGILYDDKWFPTFYQGTGSADAVVRPGQHQEGTPAMGQRNAAQYLADLPKFLDLYIPALSKLFSAEGSNEVAVTVARTAGSTMPLDSRHFCHASITPHYWIEPTSLIPHDFLGSQAEANGSGSYATVDSPRSRLAWEDIEASGECDTSFSGYAAVMRNPRSAWFFAHWLGHGLNGLGAITVRQLDPTGIIQPGACDARPDVRDRVENNDPFTDFMWVRGQSPFPAPGEMLNLAGTVGFFVKHITMDDDGIPTVEHVPTSREFASTSVTIQVGRPVGISNGGNNAADSTARRARTRAARELAAVSARVRAFGRSSVAEMPTLTTAPVMRRAQPVTHERDTIGGGQAGTRMGSKAPGDDAGDSERVAVGNARPAVPQYGSQNFPSVQLPRQGGIIGGGNPPTPPAVVAGPNNDDQGPAQPVNPAPGN